MNDKTKAAPAKPDKQKENPYARLEESLGAVVNLMAAHPSYAGKTVKEIHERVLPALATRQFRLVRDDEGRAVAYLSWAMVSESAEERITAEGGSPKPSDWQSGKTGLLMDVVAPDGGTAQQMIRRLKAEVFPGKVLKAYAAKPGNGKAELSEVR